MPGERNTMPVDTHNHIHFNTGTPAPSGPAGNWTLTWNDEFDGAAVDTDKWYVVTAGNGIGNNGTPSYAANATVSGSILTLALLSATSGACLISSDVRNNPAPPGGYRLPVGGVAEASMNFPGSSGGSAYNWPAFWMVGGIEPDWPDCGEYDVAENPDGTMTPHVIGTSLNAGGGTIAGTWVNGFHTYTVHRTASMIYFYWDGTVIFQHAPSDTGIGHGFILNNGKASRAGQQASYPAYVLVDYIRAWEPA